MFKHCFSHTIILVEYIEYISRFEFLRILVWTTIICAFLLKYSFYFLFENTVYCKGDQSGRLQEIPQLIIVNEILLQPTSRRFLRELDEAPRGNNLHYILQCLRVPALVTRV